MPKERDSPTIVFRTSYRIATRVVEPARFAFLEALGEGGADVQEAAAHAASRSGSDTGAMLADLALWLPLAGGEGLVASH